MKEFGSDFHYFLVSKEHDGILGDKKMLYYADGRHAIQHLITCKQLSNEWKRLWMPEYFCYEVVNAIRETGIEVLFYIDYPRNDDTRVIESIPFRAGDVLFRMNYFGLRSFRDNSKVPVEVIEDHSHDLISDWSLNSNANWCVASLRKTLPLPEGGILWSPRGGKLPEQLSSSLVNELVSYKRLSAMLLKRLYLEDLFHDKNEFRGMFIDGEQQLSSLQLSGMSEVALRQLKQIDIERVYEIKKENWNILKQKLEKKIDFLRPEKNESGTPFSLVLKFQDGDKRDAVRKRLTSNHVYSAILWEIPVKQSVDLISFSKSLLSVHCDARYASSDMEDLSNRILLSMN